MHIKRSGFTLVEMMVAMTLTIFVMVILSQCFIQGLETFSGLKAIGDMQEELRTATTLLRADLSQDHFEGKRRLSDVGFVERIIAPAPGGATQAGANVIITTTQPHNFRVGQSVTVSQVGQPGYNGTWQITQILSTTQFMYQAVPGAPALPASGGGGARAWLEGFREGFFVIGSGYPFTPVPVGPSPPNPPLSSSRKFLEGTEDLLPSYRFTDHFLHFTSRMRGNQRDKFFAAPAPGLGAVITNFFGQGADAAFIENNNVFHSPWAEIVYVLLPTGTTLNPSTPPVAFGAGQPTPLYALYRCQYTVLPVTTSANALFIPVAPNNVPPTPTDASPYTNVAGNPVVLPGNPLPVMDFYNPTDLAREFRRRTFNPYVFFNPVPTTNSNPPRGAALVLSNVISFQVQAMTRPAAAPPLGDFVELGEMALDSNPNPNQRRRYYIPFDTANYDTANYLGAPATAPSIPLPAPFSPLTPVMPTTYNGFYSNPDNYTIHALQIVIRIWDPRSQLTRQVTLIQDM